MIALGQLSLNNHQWILPRSYHGLITWGQLQLLFITPAEPHTGPVVVEWSQTTEAQCLQTTCSVIYCTCLHNILV